MKTKRMAKIAASPKVVGKQIHKNFTGFDIFRGEHPDDDTGSFQKAIKVRMTPTKRRRLSYRFKQPIHRPA